MAEEDPKQLVARGYDQIADGYLDRFGASAVRLRKLGELGAALTPSAHVLDLGCGAGIPVARELTARGFTVTAIDGSAEQVARARRNVPAARVIHADMTAIELPAHAFDAVAAFYSISHVPRAQHGELLRRIAGWLKPGGLFLGNFGAAPTDGYERDWLGACMYFSHHDIDTTLGLLHDASLRAELIEVIRQDDEDADFLWVTARAA